MTDHSFEQPGARDGRRASVLLHDATADLAPDVDRLVQGGVARGRTRRRRRRVGTSLAAVAVVGVLGAAAGAGSGLLGSGADSAPSRYADSPSPSAGTTATRGSRPVDATTRLPIDARLSVAAEDVPAVIGGLVPGGTVGDILRDPPYGVVEGEQEKIVHFLYDGTLTTFVIERADSVATCAEQVDPANQADGEPGGECVEQDGVLLLRSEPETADGVTAQGVTAFVHGYVVSALSYDDADGKDAAPLLGRPPLSMAELTTIVTSEEWFGS